MFSRCEGNGDATKNYHAGGDLPRGRWGSQPQRRLQRLPERVIGDKPLVTYGIHTFGQRIVNFKEPAAR